VHFTWYEYLLKVSSENVHVAASIFGAAFIVLLSLVGRLSLGSGEAAIVPAGRFSVKGFFEFLTEFIEGLCETMFGHDGAKFIPHFASIFTFIMINNLIGLLPGMVSSTANINAAFAVAIISFVFYNALGLIWGGWHYLAHFFGPVLKWWALPIMAIMFPIEIISHCVRPLSLSMRLSVNMTADHTILGTFVELTKIGIPVIFYGMGAFVSLLQAFVFTLLSMVYVMLAIPTEEH
jgi:F-type H+-transporting ATPase subunit a